MVERILGKAEVVSSILTGSTSFLTSLPQRALDEHPAERTVTLPPHARKLGIWSPPPAEMPLARPFLAFLANPDLVAT